MKSTSLWVGLLLLATSAPPVAGQVATSRLHDTRLHEISDPDTRAWWQATEALSNNAMAGRDMGSATYNRAAQ